MKHSGILLATAWFCGTLASPVSGQIQALDLNETTPAGDALRMIVVQSKPEDKLVHLNKFVQEYANHSAAPWAWRQLLEINTNAQQTVPALMAAEKVLTYDRDDLDTAYKALKMVEQKNDPVAVKKWAGRVEEIARRTTNEPCARKQIVVTQCEQGQELARQVLPYIEYLRYVDILKIAEPKKRLAAIELFLKDCPKSEYARQAESLAFYTYQQIGDAGKAYQAALAFLKDGDDNDDILLLVAERMFQEGRDREKVSQYASRALEVLQTKEKPANQEAAEFERYKNANLRRAHWLVGRIASDQGNYAVADQHLRAALPALKSDSQMLASALFHLGWANYKLGRLNEAYKFNQQCVNIPGVHQDGARRNMQVIEAELK